MLYLDYNASAPIMPQVVEYMNDIYMDKIGNADSKHAYGFHCKQIINQAKKTILSCVPARKYDMYFTSGATESNNIAIQGLIKYANETNRKHIVTTSIEHKSVLNTMKYMQSIGFEVQFVDPDQTGSVNTQDVISRIRDDTLLVSVMHVNNETGCIQPVEEICNYVKNTNALMHIDATQSFCKLMLDIKKLDFDMLSFSAHKFGGPQGVGGLIFDPETVHLNSVYHGGQQQDGIRPGTLPTALIGGCGKAAELWIKNYEKYSYKCHKIYDEITQLIEGIIGKGNYAINGQYTVDNVINIRFIGVNKDMTSFIENCAVSGGSACNSNNSAPSYVLKAMGLTDEECNQSVRISWGHETYDDIHSNEQMSKFLKVIKHLQQVSLQ